MSGTCIMINSENDIYLAQHHVRMLMNQLLFSDMDKQKVIVSVSELTRNIIDHAGSRGCFSCEPLEGRGIRICVQDQGEGISNLNQVLNGAEYSNRRGLGLGLAGTMRMMDEFVINTSREGTKIVCVKWKGTK